MDRSRLRRNSILNNQYLLVQLLGKGGFSEVWKAFDLGPRLAYVAVKVHQLNDAWSDEKKNNYTKHATREYQIHRDLAHDNVVRLYDVFEIDLNAFATVLELCQGGDLDQRLKAEKCLAEADARPILLQMLAGLRYLNLLPQEPGAGGGGAGGGDDSSSQASQSHAGAASHGGGGSSSSATSDTSSSAGVAATLARHSAKANGLAGRRAIIHYDLKPGNILFDSHGDAKITDFGLSKIVEDLADGPDIELTSQGAGTYWYLPPECFMVGAKDAPRISSKVDVWSVGVIFYQMLYGKRPFGEGQTQEQLLHRSTMLKATNVEFDEKPKVSEHAKDFIRTCLTHRMGERPDVLGLCRHPYLRNNPNKK